MTEDRINQIINEEISKADVESIASKKIENAYSSRNFDKAVRKVVADSLADLFRTLWNRNSTWKGGVAK